jgi:formylmethanofuran dehydrogenase subunit C
MLQKIQPVRPMIGGEKLVAGQLAQPCGIIEKGAAVIGQGGKGPSHGPSPGAGTVIVKYGSRRPADQQGDQQN